MICGGTYLINSKGQYPNFNVFFVIHNKISKVQLVAAIRQNDKPFLFNIRKLNGVQVYDTTTEKEKLSLGIQITNINKKIFNIAPYAEIVKSFQQ